MLSDGEVRYVDDWRQNLIAGVEPEIFEADLRAGTGRELEGKFRAAHSSSALAVNVFAPFRRGGRGFAVGRYGQGRLVGFEQRYPTGLASAQPPHLDVVVEGAGGVLGIESKCTEYLAPKAAKFSER